MKASYEAWELRSEVGNPLSHALPTRASANYLGTTRGTLSLGDAAGPPL